MTVEERLEALEKETASERCTGDQRIKEQIFLRTGYKELG